MKKLNKKGFTLIELLAVIVIMGILMLVAIPAISRYITNSRKDTYLNTVKEMVNVAKNANADRDSSVGCKITGDSYTETPDAAYCLHMKSDNSIGDVLDNKTNSPIKTDKAIEAWVCFDSDYKVSSVSATDTANKIESGTSIANGLSALSRGSIKTSGTAGAVEGARDCRIK